MRFSEIVSEALVGTVGTTPPTVQPTFKSGSTPVQKQPQNKPDQKLQQLAATLKSSQVAQNDQDVNNFMSGFQATQANKPLNPAQSKTMANLAGALLKDKSLGQKLDLQLKTMSQQQPGNNTTSTQTTLGQM